MSSWFGSALSSLAIGLLGIAASIVSTRTLGPAGRGMLAEAMLWSSLVIACGALVNTQSVVFLWSRARKTGTTREIVGASLFLAVTLSFVLTGLARLIHCAVLSTDGDETLDLANLYSWTIPLSLCAACFAPVWLAEGRWEGYWRLRILYAAFYTGGIGIVAVAGALSAKACVVIALGAMAIQTGAAITAFLRVLPASAGWSTPAIRAMAAYGARANLSGLPFHVNAKLDQILMAIFLAPDALGLYVAALAWSSTLSFLGGGLSSVMLSRSAAASPGDLPAIIALVGDFRRIFIAIVLVGIGAAALAPIAVPLLFGARFAQAAPLAIILCVAQIASTGTLILHEFARGLGATNLCIYAQWLGLLVGGSLMAALLPLAGATGAAVAAAGGAFAVLAATILFLSGRTGVRAAMFVIASRSDLLELVRGALSPRLSRDACRVAE